MERCKFNLFLQIDSLYFEKNNQKKIKLINKTKMHHKDLRDWSIKDNQKQNKKAVLKFI